MKKLSSQLLKEIEDSKDLPPLLKNDILEFVSYMLGIRGIIKAARAHVFHTRFITPAELEVNQPALIKSLLGYDESEKPDYSFDDFFSSIHPEDIADFSNMMDGFYKNKCSSYSGIFRFMNKSGDYMWLFGRAYYTGIDEMTGKPKISGIAIEICDTFNTPAQLDLLNKKILQKKFKEFADRFTPLELKVVKLIGDGFTCNEIAGKLNISESYLNSTKTNLFNKTGAKNSAHLVKIFCNFGLM